MNTLSHENIEVSKGKSIKDIIIEHKKEIRMGVGIVSLFALTVLGFKYYDKIDLKKIEEEFGKSKIGLADNSSELFSEMSEDIQKENNYREKIIRVSEYFRNLPVGHKVSERKLAEAKVKGITIPFNMTIVDGYEYIKESA